MLVIDDEQDIREGMSDLLKRSGCRVVCAEDGVEAMSLIVDQDFVPEVLVADYRLPGDHNGIELIKHIRQELNVNIPSILITGDTAPERISEAEASGLEILYKPVTPDLLRAALQRAMP